MEGGRERDVESFNLWSILYGFVFVVRVGLGSGKRLKTLNSRDSRGLSKRNLKMFYVICLLKNNLFLKNNFFKK